MILVVLIALLQAVHAVVILVHVLDVFPRLFCVLDALAYGAVRAVFAEFLEKPAVAAICSDVRRTEDVIAGLPREGTPGVNMLLCSHRFAFPRVAGR